MVEGALLRWALTTHGGTVLILILGYFLLREQLDKRYRKLDDCPSKESYDMFITKEAHEEKEKRMDEVVGIIKDRLEHLENKIETKFDQVIELLRERIK